MPCLSVSSSTAPAGPTPHPGPVSGSGLFPGGNFDLERMRVTELAAAQGRAVSLRPGLGCPCHLPAHWDTRQSLQGSGDTEGIFPAFFPR